jgi:hypothetical protein
MLAYLQNKRLDPEFRKKEAEYKKAYVLRKKMLNLKNSETLGES